MYKCDNCNKLQKFATKEQKIKATRLKTRTKLPISALKLVVETRPKQYETKIVRKINGKKKEIVIKSEGHEIVREWDLCTGCYNGLQQKDS